MILVTGGTGLVGAHLLYNLLNEEQPVRAIYRDEKKWDSVKRIFTYYTSKPEDLFNKIEWIKTDLNDIPNLSEAFEGITHVYHCAAYVSLEPNKFEKLKQTNIDGTANIVNMCIANKIKKLCFVSSIATLGTAKNNTLINENTEWNSENKNSDYAITKFGAELEVWRATQEGVDAIIVNPGVIIGAGIWKHGSGSIIKSIHKGLPYYTSGSVGYIAVEDVVNAMILLMQSEIKNERFIIVSENWSYKTFIQTCAKYLNVKAPNKKASQWLLQLGNLLDYLKHKITGKRRVLSKSLIESLNTDSRYDNSKVKNIIPITFSPIEDTIKNVCKRYLKDLKD